MNALAEASSRASADLPQSGRTLWNARVFPAECDPQAYRHWHWLQDDDRATADQKHRFSAADRYSSAEIAVRAVIGKGL